jgi:hypothetical protein
LAGTNREASRLGINLTPTRAPQQERGAIDVEFSNKDSRPLFCACPPIGSTSLGRPFKLMAVPLG